ncbi:MAG TPA: bifunctional methylenetetrahydrofolate dehydrogenase/methenyltetrahydrofolate cyclohydrolase FolD [Methanoregulaceae archaeon]|nr:bifunctional methylenetetrahydrofolate dehydrogenase/methenyltetrahydrofolate cyclohydrolase FolD [Methanoregulaceae archaeon]
MIIDGKKIAGKRLELLKEKIDESGLYPRLATVLVGNDPGSQMYVRMKHEACERVHIGSVRVELPGDATTDQVLREIIKLNKDPYIDGILVQLPLPSKVATPKIIACVSPEKDVDGFNPYNMGLLFSGTPGLVPCTPKGIMTLLDEYRIPLRGAGVVVAGRSIDVGRPVAALLLQADATVTIAHSKTRDLAAEMKRADIVITAIGKAKFIGPEMIRDGATVIDVGINYLDGKLCGDVDFESVKQVAGAITPVPGGVGPMTIASLMENTYIAAINRSCSNAG